MGDGEELVIRLLVCLVFGGGTAAIAHSKGRNPVGWFFVGFIITCIGLIIILCLSNLNEEEARFAAQEAQNRRLKEQLRQEQMKLEALRQHTTARLDQHDQELGVDTRTFGAALPGSPDTQRPSLPDLSGEQPDASANAYSEEWYYLAEDEQRGPVSR